jgi:integrase
MEQVMRFLETAENDRLGAMFTKMLSLGLREGEGTDLKAETIDLDKRTIRVRRSLQVTETPDDKEGRCTERPPKAKSKRDLPITETICRGGRWRLRRRKAGRTPATCYPASPARRSICGTYWDRSTSSATPQRFRECAFTTRGVRAGRCCTFRAPTRS